MKSLRLKDLVTEGELLTSGHRACPGCGGTIIIRQMLHAAGPNTVVVMCTGCMEVVTTIYPYTAWRVPFLHAAFENAASVAAGAEAAYQSLKRQGKITDDINIIALGGDGGTYDIGLYDNEAYMNTGIQRSGSTPLGAATSTSPAGKVLAGKQQSRKDLTAVMIGHKIPYVAQAAPHNYRDFMNKVQKALAVKGAAFINVLSPCPLGWRYPAERTIEISKLATDTCFWPLYEVENGKVKINYKPREKKPLVEWLKPQRRFSHLFTETNKHIIDRLQEEVDRDWEKLLAQEEAGK